MIYIFGSLHIDPNETKELNKMLSAAKNNLIIAIELSSNKETQGALEKFKTIPICAVYTLYKSTDLWC